MSKNFSIYVLLLLVSFSVTAQVQNRFRFIQYSTENGLPSNGIKGLAFDEQTGFLWIGTEAGIVRFNGIDFKVFSGNNLPAFTSERVPYLIRNNKTDIFAADDKDHIFKINAYLPVLYDEIHSDPGAFYRREFSNTVTDTSLMRNIRYAVTNNYFRNIIKSIPISDTAALLLNSSNELSFISANIKEPDQLLLPGLSVKNVFKINKNCFVVSMDDHIYKLQPVTGKVTPVEIKSMDDLSEVKGHNKKLILWETGMANPIMLEGNNAWLLNNDGGSINAQLICTTVPKNSFIRYAEYSKKNGILFLGTESKGLIIVRQNNLSVMKSQKNVFTERNAYYSQVLLNDGSVLTNEGHIIGLKGSTTAVVPIKGSFNYPVYRLSDSLLCYGQFDSNFKRNCLHIYNYKTRQTISYPKIVIKQRFAAIYHAGNLYINIDEGFAILKNDSLHYLFRTPIERWNGAEPFAMEEIKPGVFMVASCNGLVAYDINKRTIDTILQLPGYCIRSINKIGQYYFIGTYGMGFYIYRNGIIKKMPLDKNNFLMYAHCIVPDEVGFCWISTNRGLFKVKLLDILDAFEKNITQVYYHYLGKNDGMDITEMNGGCSPCALQLKNKVISFPTMDGLLWVDPQNAKVLLPEGNIFIDEVQVDNLKIEPVLLSQNNPVKILPANTRSIKINLAYAAWCNNENIYLDYRLNKDEQWQPVNTNNGAIIQLDNLPSGEYNLEIRKNNGFGNENYSYKELKFNIGAPWYQRWWFYGLMIAALVGITMLYIYFRTKQYKIKQQRLEKQVAEKTQTLQVKNEALEKNNQINQRLISIISHDIITPLKFVTMGGKELVEKKDRMPEELQEETLIEITNTALEIQLLSTNIMNWIKYQNENRRQQKEFFNVHELTNQAIGVLHAIAKQKNIPIINEVDQQLVVYQYLEPLKILIYNLISNAINFSSQGSITVSSDKNEESITIHIKDKGVGMTAEQIANIMSDEFIISSANIDNRKGNGLGYLIIKDLLKMLEGSLRIQSKKWEGTIVSVNFLSKSLDKPN